MSKHILLISQYFYPENFRVNDMACEWVNRGYKVTVLTGIPNYPQGMFYEGYDRKHRTREQWNGVNIIRIPLIARGNSKNRLFNAVRMTANYFSFVRSGRKWVKSKTAKELNPDLVFTFEVSPMTQALIGVWYGKRYHVPTFLYVQDLWPENVELITGIHNPLIIKPIDKMVDYIYKNTNRIFTTSESFRSAIIGRKKHVPENKVFCWHQYAEDFYKPIEQDAVQHTEETDALRNSDAIKIGFTGNIGAAQGLDILPRTAKELQKREIKPADVVFIIVGDGRYKKQLLKEIDETGVNGYFRFLGQKPAESIPIYLSLCDIAYLSCNESKTIPAKLQSYMACGKCILANAGFETERIIRDSKSGVCCNVGNEKELADAIQSFLSDKGVLSEYGKNARTYFLSHFDKKMLMDKMDKYFQDL